MTKSEVFEDVKNEPDFIQVIQNHQGAWGWEEVPYHPGWRYSGCLWWDMSEAVQSAVQAANGLRVVAVVDDLDKAVGK